MPDYLERSLQKIPEGAFGAHTNIPLLYREVAGLLDLGLRVYG